MFKSFLCRLFSCGCKSKIYSANIEENQGFDNPAPIVEIDGWTVWKHQQTEIYVITHNLGLANPERQLHIVATPMEKDTVLIIESIESNQFTVSTWNIHGASKDSSFMFIAVHNP